MHRVDAPRYGDRLDRKPSPQAQPSMLSGAGPYGTEGATLGLGSQTTTPSSEGESFLSGGDPMVVRARRVERTNEPPTPFTPSPS